MHLRFKCHSNFTFSGINYHHNKIHSKKKKLYNLLFDNKNKKSKMRIKQNLVFFTQKPQQYYPPKENC
jgi:hypothetical protein